MMDFLKQRFGRVIGASALALVSGLAVPAQAADWQKVLECDDGAAVLDIRERRGVELVDYQLVIRSAAINKYLVSEGLEEPAETGEVIIPFVVYREQEILARYTYNSHLEAPVIETVRRSNQGRSLSFDIYRAENAPGGLLLQRERIGGWTFWSCAHPVIP